IQRAAAVSAVAPCRWATVRAGDGRALARCGRRVYDAGVMRFGKKWLSGCLLVGLLASPATAWAQEGEEEYYYTEYERTWYGWQTLAIDVPTLSVFFFTLREEKYVPAYTSLSLFCLGAPAVHGAHGQWKQAALSGLTRVTFSLVGAVGVQGIAKAIDGDASEDSQRAAAVVVTNLVAVGFDAFLLAYEDEETRVEFETGEKKGGWWMPQVGLSGQGGGGF
ncbi:MAG: hypothetical protein ACOC1F_04895, partial [Myxococcota bacterium]